MNYKIIGKFVKNLKFEIPSSKTFFLLEKNISNYKINIDIKSQQIKEKVIEVIVTLSLNPIEIVLDKINTEIVFSTIIEVEGDLTEKTLLKEIILIKVPSKVYPEIRSLFVLLFERSGFNNIKIEEKVNFKELYLKRVIQ